MAYRRKVINGEVVRKESRAAPRPAALSAARYAAVAAMALATVSVKAATVDDIVMEYVPECRVTQCVIHRDLRPILVLACDDDKRHMRVFRSVKDHNGLTLLVAQSGPCKVI